MKNDIALLKTLLTADEDSAEYRAAVARFEASPTLYPQLEQLLLQDAQWLQDVPAGLREDGLPELQSSGSLSGSVVIEVNEGLADDDPVDYERIRLDFLESPRHPELLGRLGRYDVERVVGSGGMGVVLKAWDTELHRMVAVKVLAPHLAHHSSARRRFAREAQAAAAVVHPHVIPIYTVESEGALPWLVMQYVAGESLQQRVTARGPLPLTDVLRIAQQTAAGLSAAHAQGLVHRDVKPANILLEEGVDRVLLSDFGLARAVDDASLTRTGIVAGTPFYMSPEQALGERLDHRSDLFSLGSVLYFMLTGRPPFCANGAMAVLHRICQQPHQPLQAVNPDIPEELCRLVDRLLAKAPADRLQTAIEVEQQLGALLVALQQGRLTSGRRVRPGGLAGRSRRAVRWLAARRQWLLLPGVFLAVTGTVLCSALLRDWLLSDGTQFGRPPAAAQRVGSPGVRDRQTGPQTEPSVVPGPASAAREPSLPAAELRRLQQELGDWQQEENRFQQDLSELQSQVQQAQQRGSGWPDQEDVFEREVRRLQSELQWRLEELQWEQP